MALATPVNIKFDAAQQFQLDSIRAVTDLLKGQPLASTPFELTPTGTSQGTLLNEYGLANNVLLAPEQIARNLHEVQVRNGITPTVDPADPASLGSLDFTDDMETGTGKTYVYLRTAFELNRIYGLTKFVIVAPSVPIREGVQANLRLLRDHFDDLYDSPQYDTWVYDSRNVSQLRSFAQTNYMQFLILNIDAFNKKDANIIPIEFIQACSPVVILDEPQNMESDSAKEAIASLNPVMTLRYSATHRNAYHPVYRLTPVDAYNLGLVKKIEVWSVTQDTDLNTPSIEVVSVKATAKTVRATCIVQAHTDAGTVPKKVLCGNGTDLEQETGRAVYAGYVVEDVDVPSQTITFGNGVAVRPGEPSGADKEQIQRAQIRTSVAQHLDRELDIARRVSAGEITNTKVLTLFFIDRVANYWPADGKFRVWFEEEYTRLAVQAKYQDLGLPDVAAVHNGYLALDKDKRAKDSRGTSEADAAAYNLIMRDKDRLLSADEPLRFIFSHSALREGWDNPNVFVICTLNDTVSEVKKRQEIGRGLRLPVSADGTRCSDPEVARLAVVANESYDDFAEQLQKEIEKDTGKAFPRSNIKKGGTRVSVKMRKGFEANAEFVALWERIQHRTTYSVAYDTEELITLAAKALKAKPALGSTMIRATKGLISMDASGVTAELTGEKAPTAVLSTYPVPDLLGHLVRALPTVSRSTIARILVQSGRLGDAHVNPQQFIDTAQSAIEDSLAELLVNGITYVKIGTSDDAVYEMRLFEENALTAYLDNMVPVDNSVFQHVVYDSDLERQIALALDAREDVKVFLKLPGWFTLETPVGRYNPDWALVKADGDGVDRLYLVQESKPSTDLSSLRPDERLKVLFGEKHFEALSKDDAVGFKVISDPRDI